MGYQETMKVPMRAFWHISGTVPRLLSSERKDSLEIATSATHNPEQAAELYAALHKQSPDPVVLSGHGKESISAVRDDAGFEELRSMAAR